MSDKMINVHKFRQWKDTMDDKLVHEYIYNGSLNKSAVAAACDFSYNALKNQNGNATLLEEFAQYQTELRERHLRLELTAKGKAEHNNPKSLDRESFKSAREQSRVPALEQEIVELKAEIAAIKGELGRFSELSDIYQEMAAME